MVKFFLKHCNFANKIRSFLIEAAFFFFWDYYVCYHYVARTDKLLYVCIGISSLYDWFLHFVPFFFSLTSLITSFLLLERCLSLELKPVRATVKQVQNWYTLCFQLIGVLILGIFRYSEFESFFLVPLSLLSWHKEDASKAGHCKCKHQVLPW